MTGLTFAVGGLLAATGVIAYVASDASSLTALIPAALGVLILLAAFISCAPKARRHALHAALAIALLGIAGTAMNVMKLGELFADCKPGAIPPVGAAYGIKTYWDEELGTRAEVYFEAGDHQTLVHMSGADFGKLMRKSATRLPESCH